MCNIAICTVKCKLSLYVVEITSYYRLLLKLFYLIYGRDYGRTESGFPTSIFEAADRMQFFCLKRAIIIIYNRFRPRPKCPPLIRKRFQSLRAI